MSPEQRIGRIDRVIDTVCNRWSNARKYLLLIAVISSSFTVVGVTAGSFDAAGVTLVTAAASGIISTKV